jgi:hypothetical protein
MENKTKAFLCGAVLAATGLLGAPAAMATGSSSSAGPTPEPLPPPTSCYAGAYLVKVTRGPAFVSCTSNASNTSGLCTEIEYEVSGGSCPPDHVASLQGVGVQYVTGGAASGNRFYMPCDGDPLTQLGKYSCHQQAAKINPNAAVQKFVVGLAGQRKPSPTSVVVKKGSVVKACTILGMGLEGVPSPFEAASTIQRIDFEGCAVDFVRSATGDVVSATLSPDSPDTCTSPFLESDGKTLKAKPVSALQLTLDSVPLGDGQIGEGYVSSGTGSCTTRIIGGKVYTWGSPCP